MCLGVGVSGGGHCTNRNKVNEGLFISSWLTHTVNACCWITVAIGQKKGINISKLSIYPVLDHFGIGRVIAIVSK